MTEYHFIVNRQSSAGAGLLKWEEAKVWLRRHGVSYQVHFPKGAAETTELVAGLTGPQMPPCHLIVIGGDGTLNAALQGIKSLEKTRFSCLAGGSANDFARDMALSHHTGRALASIFRHPTEVLLDFGELVCKKPGGEGYFRRRFLTSGGIGYDAEICALAQRSRVKKLLGNFSLGGIIYLLIGIVLIVAGRYGKARVRIDGGEIREIPLFVFTAMIHKYEGGGVAFCPDADPADGLLDLCIVKKMPVARAFRALLLLQKGRHMQMPEVSVLRCRLAEVTTTRPEWFHMDGETPFQTKAIRFTVKNGLRFIY